MEAADNTSRTDAPAITSGTPGTFAWGVLAKRHPALIQQVRDAFPYAPEQRRALDVMLEEITEGVIEPLPETAHDHSTWTAWGRECFGRSWFEAPFLWAESYFYRKLLQAVGYFAPGPWQGVDPFAPFKQAELRSEELAEELVALGDLAARPEQERAEALLHASLWGNRADLGFRISAGDAAHSAAVSHLVADDSHLLWSLLTADEPVTVNVVADNAGRELIPDLVLIDHLLRHRHASAVTLHVKPYPYYVSDAMTADVIDCLRRLLHAPGHAGEVGRRLWEAMSAGQLTVDAHPFFCAPLPYRDMPDDLRAELSNGDLTILKGDLNYRRLVGDRLWEPTISFQDATACFPGPVAALRTLKSDVITGLGMKTLTELDGSGQDWRTSGTHAVIQVRR
ncbi:damage-control phosphatase ARMT1 family protein [Nocardiopsis sp. NPDC050513]|uniref:damage-control phosphatase ARMT1 family protein n=1 Tax=Nocardiopsis sp. NPDC050513 TaxID=3364338 RepID=UPI0037B25DC9